jgi:hypothetical protein
LGGGSEPVKENLKTTFELIAGALQVVGTDNIHYMITETNCWTGINLAIVPIKDSFFDLDIKNRRLNIGYD